MKTITPNDSTFEDMIKGGNLYVDKTEYLWSLITSRSKGIYFLSRPRRFGKSLAVSTLKCIFQGKKELFKGLAIYEQYDWEQTYPVVHLNLANCNVKSAEDLRMRLFAELEDWVELYQVKVSISPGILEKSFERVIRAIAKQSSSLNVAILVDEYDKPIVNNINNPAILEIIDVLREFYATLKICDDALRFVFITGVSKFSHVSIFSGLNNLEDISMDPEYATMLGYTQAEFEENFNDFIDFLCADSIMNTDRPELLKNIKEWYDGYRFHAHTESVYNPVSIATFFSKMVKEKNTNYIDEAEKKCVFDDYWFTTGTPTFLVEYAKKKGISLVEKLDMSVSPALFKSAEVNKADIRAIMFQTGYLTISDSYRDDSGQLLYHLKYPNHEVEYSLKSYLLSESADILTNVAMEIFGKMRYALINRKLDLLILSLKKVFASSSHRIALDGESRFQYITFLFSLCDLQNEIEVTAEEATNNGTIDMVIRTPNTIYIFEFKLNQTAKVALKQIENKRYYEKFMLNGKDIFLVGVNFNSQQRQIDDWKVKRFSQYGMFLEDILPPPEDENLMGSANKP